MRSKRDRRTVEGDWFGPEGFKGLDYDHLNAFPNGQYFRVLFQCAIELMAEDALNLKS